MSLLLQRFNQKWVPEPYSGCHLWTGCTINPMERGVMRVKGKIYLASRISFQLFNGPIPPGMCVCHRCDTPSCVNPSHLFLGTQVDNVKDMTQKGRAHKGGTFFRGELISWSKLTESDVRFIRESKGRNCDLASLFGVSRSAITDIRKKKCWKGVS